MTLFQIKIVVDYRESRTEVVKYLGKMGVDLEFQQLTIADYVVSDRVAVERKSVNDFINSIFTNRVFEQCDRLKQTYEKPVIVVEGDFKRGLLSRGVKLSSVYGALSSIILDFDIPVIPSLNCESTAIFLERMAYREQVKEEEVLRVRSKPKMLDLKKKQIFFLSGLPKIGETMAVKLLKEFKSPLQVIDLIVKSRIVKSSTGKTMRLEGPMQKVKGLGPLKIKEIKEVLMSRFTE